MKFSLFLLFLFSFGAFAHDLEHWEQETLRYEEEFKTIPDSGLGCEGLIKTHLDIISRSEDLILPLLQKKRLQITPFEVVTLERNLKVRYRSLKALMVKLGSPDCSKETEAELIGVYDFHFFKERTFKKRSLKNILFDFSKIKSSELSTFKKDFKKFTDKNLVNKVLSHSEEQYSELIRSTVPTSDLEISIDHTTKTGLAFSGIRASLVSSVARIWGILSDSLKWRQGRLKNNKEAKNLVLKNLKPLSMLFEKREFVLSNYTIPGHWGHVAIWLGTKEELMERGIWDEPRFAKIKSAVEDGKNIMEIRKKGVEFVSLDSYLNLDQFAVVSYNGDLESQVSVYQNLIEHIGKKYDFNFNGQSLSKITCAELITFSFGDIKWKTSVKVGNLTILPDDLALQGVSGTDFQFELYIKGEKNKKFQLLTVEDFANTLPKPN